METDELYKPVAISAVALFIFAMLSTLPTDINESAYIEKTLIIEKAILGTNCTQFASELSASMDISEIEAFVQKHNCQLTEYGEKIQTIQVEDKFFIRLNDTQKLDYKKQIKNETRLKLSTDKIDFNYEFGTNNKLKDGKLLDAGILDLTKSAVVNPSRAFKYSQGQLKIRVEGNKSEVIVGDIYYLEEENYSVFEPIYETIYEEKEYCYKDLNTTIKDLNQVGTETCTKYNESSQIQVGTKEITKTREVKKYDYWDKLIEANKDTIFYSDLKKTQPWDSFEVYFETFEYKDKEHSWWDSADYYQILNTSMAFGVSDISSTLTTFVARINGSTSNSTIFNTTNKVGFACTWIGDNSTQLGMEVDTGWGGASTTLWTGGEKLNQTSSTQIVCWAKKDNTNSINYLVPDMWRNASYYAVFHAEDAGQSTLVDSIGQNNLTEVGSCTNSSRSSSLRIGGAVESDGTCHYDLTSGATGVPTGANHSTETARIHPDATALWGVAYAIGNADSQVNDRFVYTDGKGGQNGFAGYGADGVYTPQTTEVFNQYFLNTRYNGTNKVLGLNQTYTVGAQTLNTQNAEIYVAGRWATQYFDGMIDEIRFADAYRNDDWTKAEMALIYQMYDDGWIQITSTTSLTSSILNSTNGTTFFTEDTLYGWSNLSGLWNISCEWFMNDTSHTNETINNVQSNETGNSSNICNITAGVAKNQNWTLQMNASNATDTIAAVNSTTINISNSVPVMQNLTVPAYGHNETLITATANATDADNDSITYYYQFSNTSEIVQAFSIVNTFQCNSTACPGDLNITTLAKAGDGEENSTTLERNTTIVSTAPEEIYLWDGSAWVEYNSTNVLTFRCEITGFPAAICSPNNQNNVTGISKATSCTSTTTTDGTCANTNELDGVNWTMLESGSVGSPYNGNITFTNTSFLTASLVNVSLYANYVANSPGTHVVGVYAYNFSSSTMYRFANLTANSFTWINKTLPADNFVNSTGSVIINLNHSQSGNAAHVGPAVDYIAVEQSTPIFRKENAGVLTQTWHAIESNTTWGTDASLYCGQYVESYPTGFVNLTTLFTNYSTQNLSPGNSIGVYCFFDVQNVSSGFDRDFTVLFNGGY